MNDIVLAADGLTKRFELDRSFAGLMRMAFLPERHNRVSSLVAVDNVSLRLCRGQTIGVMGHNGAGKSTLLKIIAGILKPTQGTLRITGRVSSLLELGSAIDEEASGYDNIYHYGAVVGLTRKKIDELKDGIIHFSGISEHIHRPVKQYSSGMKARLAFAIATSSSPDILLVDEILSVGDAAFSVRSAARMRELISKGSAAIIVTHSVSMMAQLCDQVIWMDHGQMVAFGPPADLITAYSATMILPEPERSRRVRELISEYRGSGDVNKSYSPPGDMAEEAVKEIVPLEEKWTVVIEDGLASFQDITIVQDGQRDMSALRVGEPYTLQMEFDIKETRQDFSLGLSVHSRLGDVVGGQIIQLRDLLGSQLKPGQYRATAHFICPLNTGQYSLSCDLRSDERQSIHHVIKHAASFSAVAETNVARIGYVDFGFDWSVTEASAKALPEA